MIVLRAIKQYILLKFKFYRKDTCFCIFMSNQNSERQNLFPIIQSGVDDELIRECLKHLISKNANGYAIGGLAEGELKKDFKLKHS